METTTLIQNSAKVVTITEFAAGNVYKRIESSSYSPHRIVFGIVTDVIHNGTEGAIVAHEFDGFNLKAEEKVYQTGAEAALFHATPEEAVAYLDKLAGQAEEKVASARESLRSAETTMEIIRSHNNNHSALSAPTTTVRQVESLVEG